MMQKVENDRQLFFVLGMHRSGTSAVTRGLSALGINLGNNLMPPVPGINDKGFYEDRDIHALNIKIFKTLGVDPLGINFIPQSHLQNYRPASGVS